MRRASARVGSLDLDAHLRALRPRTLGDVEEDLPPSGHVQVEVLDLERDEFLVTIAPNLQPRGHRLPWRDSNLERLVVCWRDDVGFR